MKRLVSLLLAVAIVLTLFSACGGSNSGSKEQSSAANTDNGVSTAKSENTAAADTKSAEKGAAGKLVVQSWNFACGSFTQESDPVKANQKYAEYFKKFYPNVEPEFNFVQYTDHFNKLKVDFAAGEGPDVIGIQAGAPMIEFKPFLQPLASFAERDWGKDWKSKFADGAFTQIDQVGAECFGIPIIMTYAGQMWYSQTILDKYGLKAPATWDELKTEWYRSCQELYRISELYKVAE